MPKAIRIGDIVANTFEKKFGFFKIGQGINIVEVPLVIINGCEEGPTLCLTAGTHGCEYAGIAAVIRVCSKINPTELRGKIIAVPVVNTPGFRQRTPYVNPVDKLNIAETYPGKTDGSMSQVIAHTILEEVIMKADYYIDCHSGDVDERLIENTYYYRGGNEKVDNASYALCRAFGFKYIILVNGVPSYSHFKEVCRKGIPMVQSECGGLGILKESDIANYVKGITNVMKFLNMINGEPSIQVEQKIVTREFYVKVAHTGIFYSKVDLGENVRKEQIVGEVGNLQGETVEKLLATEDGVIRKIYTRHVVNPGEVVMVGYVSPKRAPPFEEEKR